MSIGYPLPRQEWPKCLLPFPQVKELWVGGCKDGDDFFGDPKYIIRAHAHGYPDPGVICTPYRFSIRSKNLMLHELAHVLVGCRHGHDEVWKSKFLQLGGTDSEIRSFLDPWRQLNDFAACGELVLRGIDKLPFHFMSCYK